MPEVAEREGSKVLPLEEIICQAEEALLQLETKLSLESE